MACSFTWALPYSKVPKRASVSTGGDDLGTVYFYNFL